MKLTHAVAFTCLLATAAARAQFTGPAFEATVPPNTLPVPTATAALLSTPPADLKVEPGDTLTIKLFNVPDYAPPIRISQDGTAQLPLIGKLTLAGLTLHQAEDSIAQHLVEAGMYRAPQVTVQFTDFSNKFATITGEVRAVVPILGERHLYDVLAASNPGGNGTGLPVTASRVVTILRPGLATPIVVDMGMDPTRSAEANIQILPHDTIVISHVGMVYVIGAFKTQGAIPLDQSAPLTLMQAAALSGGAGYEGKLNDLRIIRNFGTERRVVPIDVGKVFHSKAPDPVLQAGDIIFLPSSSIKAALKANALSSVSSLASLLIIGLQYR